MQGYTYFAEHATGGVLDLPWFQNLGSDIGSVTVDDSTSGTIASYVVNYRDEGFTGLLLTGRPLANLAVEAKIHLDFSEDWVYRGLALRVPAATLAYYRFVVRNRQAQAPLLQLQANDGTSLRDLMFWSTDSLPEINLTTGWHTLQLIADRNAFWAAVDGVLLPGSPVVSTLSASIDGYPGIYGFSAGGQNIKFDDFIVSAVGLEITVDWRAQNNSLRFDGIASDATTGRTVCFDREKQTVYFFDRNNTGAEPETVFVLPDSLGGSQLTALAIGSDGSTYFALTDAQNSRLLRADRKLRSLATVSRLDEAIVALNFNTSGAGAILYALGTGGTVFRCSLASVKANSVEKLFSIPGNNTSLAVSRDGEAFFTAGAGQPIQKWYAAGNRDTTDFSFDLAAAGKVYDVHLAPGDSILYALFADSDTLLAAAKIDAFTGEVLTSTPLVENYSPLAEWRFAPLFDRELFWVSTTGERGRATDRTVPTRNHPPLADAGDDHRVALAAQVTLDGQNSIDPDGDTINYQWQLVSGPDAVAMMDSTAPQFHFQPVVIGDYVFALQVRDGELASAADSVHVFVAIHEDTLTFDDGNPQHFTVGATGDVWQIAATADAYLGTHRFTDKYANRSAVARWQIEVDETMPYEVYVSRVPESTNSTSFAPYLVDSGDGTVAIKIVRQCGIAADSVWQLLGTYTFFVDRPGWVALVNDTVITFQDSLPMLRADAVMLRPVQTVGVRLTTFYADHEGGHIVLYWVDGDGSGRNVFNLYRTETTVPPPPAAPSLNTVLLHGTASYRFDDTAATYGRIYYYWLEEVSPAGVKTLHGPITAEWGQSLPTAFALSANFPNPFSVRTVFKLALPGPSEVSAIVYNRLGQQIQVLTKQHYAAGIYNLSWDGRDELRREVSNGLYFLQVVAGDFRAVLKLALVR